jgi:threonine dehydrogenase-like Zn-dependent dehydrogenase
MEAIKKKLDPMVHPKTETPLSTTVDPLKSSTQKMLACQWYGKEDVRVIESSKPLITQPKDCVVRVTTASICGSDLHLYYNKVPGVAVNQRGDILGHESMGIVESVGPEVQNLKVGDRVVVSCVVACGSCFYCQNKMFSCCDTTNPSGQMEKQYGHRTGALFGYSHLTGGYDGGQAEYIRVPFADLNCLKVPDRLTDEQVIFLSDVLCTGWHGCELAEVSQDQTVAVWGCGPVGLACIAWCRFRGAKQIIAIDDCRYRLDVAKTRLGACIINFKEVEDVTKAISNMCPGGPDACIDCAGFRFPTSFLHKVEQKLGMETDALDIINQMVLSCRKAGKIALIGDYFGSGNHFPIGAMMEKGLTMRGGQVFVQKYWQELLSYIESGKFDPTFMITHTYPLEQAAEAYRKFAHQEDNCIKVLLKPRVSGLSR